MRCPSSTFQPILPWTCIKSACLLTSELREPPMMPGCPSPELAFVARRAMMAKFPAGGIFVTNRAIRLCGVTDGISKTICVGEESDFAVDSLGRQRNIDAGYPIGWLVGTNSAGTPPNYQNSSNPALPAPSAWNITTIKYLPNTRTFELPGVKDNPRGPNNPLSSQHAGGVHVLFLDGSAHFITDTMDLLMLRELSTRDDGS